MFYVAVTRAKQNLFLSSSHGRAKSFYDSWFFVKTSRFIEPLIDEDVIDTFMLSVEDQTDSFPSYRRKKQFSGGLEESYIPEDDVDAF